MTTIEQMKLLARKDLLALIGVTLVMDSKNIYIYIFSLAGQLNQPDNEITFLLWASNPPTAQSLET